jgi:cytochrome b involved in lipid metabolism
MPPNTLEAKILTEEKRELISKSDKDTKQEILYEGYYYDITSFIPRHPGGSVIKFYTPPGEDATLAIQQFHNRSLKQVLAIMKTLPKRPIDPERGT